MIDFSYVHLFMHFTWQKFDVIYYITNYGVYRRISDMAL